MKRNDQAKIDILSAIDDEIVERNSIKRYRLIKRLENAPKRRKIWAFSSVAACLLAVLIGVFVILEAFVKQVPIYTGMTISSAKREDRIVASVDAPLMLDASGKLPTLNALFAQEKGDQGNHYGNQIDQENPFGNGNGKRPVEDVVEESLEVVGADRAIYYAQPNEDIYITIHIDNPDNFEILSFTLNGKKYSSYMFEDGSDMENLILKVNVGDVEGIVEYTIDAIKYVDGTDIKDVRMEGDKTVRAGVATEKQPTAAVSNELIGLYSVAFDVLVEDPLALIERSVGELYAVLYDGEQLVATKELEVGKKTNVEFDKLEDGKLYQYAIVANYDALDGTGFGGYALTKKAFYTNTLVAFDALSVTKEGVSFAYVWNDAVKDKTVTSLTLYRNGEKVRELEATATSVSGLLSDNEYTLVAGVVNRRENDSISVTFTTAKKTTPTVAITNPTKTQTSIGFGIGMTDPDQVGAITKIELLHGNDTPVVAENVSIRAFNSLLSNNDYTVRVTYTYDLNDGKGAQTIVKTLGIKTEAKATPVVGITAEQTSNEGIKGIRFEISETDTDEVGSISNIVLTDSKGAVVHTGNAEIRFFNELTLKETYTVKVIYTYDLNDGNGVQESQKETTLKILPDMNTPYTVKHYLQNANDDGYTLFETENLVGEEQADVTPALKSYDGFTAPDAQTKMIVWDGSMLIEYYYIRNSYTVTYVSNGGSEHAQVTLRHGQDIPLPTPTRGSDTFGGWFTDVSLTQAPSTLPIGGVTLYARWAEETATGAFNFTGNTEITITKLKSALTAVVIPTYIGGAPVTAIGDDAFLNCSALANVTLPNGLKSIGYQAFLGCSALTLITIPESVVELGERAFHSSGLTSIVIPGSIKTIPYMAFAYTDLTSVVISEGVETVGKLAFYNSEALIRITIPASVIKFDEDAFLRCEIETVYYQGTLETWCRIEFVNGEAYPVSYDNRTYFGSTLLSTMTEIVIPDSITEIKDYTFMEWRQLTSVTIPNTVTSIGDYSFYRCWFTEITIPNSVTSIGSHAFENCDYLTHLTIADSVISIGKDAFAGCDITNATIPCLAISYLPKEYLVEVVLTSGTSIPAYAFEGCSNLTTLVIPDSVTEIGENAFLGCTSLTNAYYCGTATEWAAVDIKNISNNALTNATVYYYSETAPVEEGNYWRYVNGVPTAW